MNQKDIMFCWTYNLVDRDRYASIIGTGGVDLVIDIDDDEKVDAATNMVMQRVARLKDIDAAKFTLNFDIDVSSFNLLKMGASVATRGKEWYLQKEAALFKKRIESLDAKTIEWFMNEVFYTGNVMSRAMHGDEKNYKENALAPDKIKIRWQYLSDLIQDRKFTVRDGWIYASASDVLENMVNLFKTLIAMDTRETARRVERSGLKEALKGYAAILDSMVETFNIPGDSPASYIMDRSPACMRLLDKDMGNGADIGYIGNLILSFYLKSYIDQPSLVQYYYSRNPGNARSHASVESFLVARKELDYIFKQMYGETGSGVSYNSYACKSISGEGLCPFASFSNKASDQETIAGVKMLLENIDGNMFSGMDENTVNVICNLFSLMVRRNSGFKTACGLEFQLRFDKENTAREIVTATGRRERKKIVHPVKSYLDVVLEMEKREGRSNQR